GSRSRSRSRRLLSCRAIDGGHLSRSSFSRLPVGAPHNDDVAALFAANFEHFAAHFFVGNRIFGGAIVANDLHTALPLTVAGRMVAPNVVIVVEPIKCSFPQHWLQAISQPMSVPHPHLPTNSNLPTSVCIWSSPPHSNTPKAA